MSTPDGSIRILISAGLDRSVEASFGTIERMAERAGKNVAKSLGAGNSGDGVVRGMRTIATEADKAAKEVEKSFNRQVKSAEKAMRDEHRAAEKEARERSRLGEQVAREREKSFRAETRAAEREAQNQVRAQEAAMRKVEAEHRRFAERVSHRAVRFMFPNPIGVFGMGARIGQDILRGAGIDFSVAGSVSRAVGAQALATQLSSQGFMKGEKGPNGTRVASATLEDEARKVAKDQRMDTEQMLRAQTKFVDITGNLNDARGALSGIAALSGATGTDPEKMAEAWANVSRHIGDVPNKAQKVEGLMRLIAGQGRVGSIEIKDEAKDLGKIAAMADKFGGDRAETIGKLTTLAQLAKAEGGAASSAQAATSIVSFAGTFDKGARLKKLMGLGLTEDDIFNMTGTGKNRVRSSIKDPFEIIKKVLEKTGGDMTKFAGAFQSVMSQRATNALVAAYNSGGGHNMAAVDAKLNEVGAEATLTPEQITENNAERFKTDEAKAKEFQNALDEVIATTKTELTPALIELKEPALQAAHFLAEMVGAAAKHPLEAVGIAISAAIGRSLLEAGFRSILEKSITNAMANGNGLQIAGAGLMITVTAATIVAHLIDEDVVALEIDGPDPALDNANAGVVESRVQGSIRDRSAVTDTDKKNLETIDADLETRIRKAQGQKDWDKQFGAPTNPAAMALEHALFPQRTAARNDAQHLRELKAELAANQRVLEQIRSGTLRVIVTNAHEIASNGPKVYAPGRGPDPSNPPGPWR